MIRGASVSGGVTEGVSTLPDLKQLAQLERLLRLGAESIEATESLLAELRSLQARNLYCGTDIGALQDDLDMARRLQAGRQRDHEAMLERSTIRTLATASSGVEIDGLELSLAMGPDSPRDVQQQPPAESWSAIRIIATSVTLTD
jgi:hypothetical protein